MKTNISFFGASVTEQANGYVKSFSNLIGDEFIVSKYGYGSMHIKDAGVIFIDEVLKSKPHYCFIEWFCTLFVPPTEILEEYLNAIVYKLFNNNCLPIFVLISGDKTILYPDRIRMYKDASNYAKQNNIPFISIYDHPEIQQYETSTLFRDSVHTNDVGSKIYANIIYDQFINEIYGKFDLPNNVELEFPLSSPRILPPQTRFHDIKKIEFPHNIKITKTIEINGKGRIVGLHQNIGPHSGLIEISGESYKQQYNLWDAWCYYCRDNIKIEAEIDGHLKINILQDQFDTSSAKEKVEPLSKKHIKPYSLYYIGTIDSMTYE
jgi:hypothetical protein